jgi:crossover junction endodeoxyribonuclease RuvC
LRITGYGLVAERTNRLIAVEYGAIKTNSGADFTERLVEIVTELGQIIVEHKPDCASVEQIFSAVNIKTALILGHVRGAIITEIKRHGIPLFEYSPLAIKQAVVGYGRAEKSQVGEMCKVLLQLDKAPEPMDASDALAAAICHINSRRFCAES